MTWEPPPDQSSLSPLSEAELGSVEPGELVNNLTRPEDLSALAAEKGLDYGMGEEEYNYVQDFDRLSAKVDEGGGFTSEVLLARGDLVHLRSGSSSPLLGVFLGVSSQRRYVYYTSQGIFYVSDNRSGEFQVPGLFTEEEIAPLLPYLDTAADSEAQTSRVLRKPQVDMPRELAAPIIRTMRAFRREIELYYRKYASGLDTAFEKIAHPTEVTFRTLEDVIAVVTGLPVPANGEYPPAMQFAISNALLKEKFGFKYEQRLYSSQKVLTVLARHNLESVYRVQSWLRAYWEEQSRQSAGLPVLPVITEGALVAKRFATKCQTLIAESRRLRRASGTRLDVITCNQGENPTEEKVPQAVSWSETDRDFIKVLHLHCSADALHKVQAFQWMPPSIVRMTNSFEELESLHLGTSWTLLTEIGLVQPFTDPEPFDIAVRPANVALNMSLNRIGQRVMSGQSLLEAAHLRDSMSELRKDWGDLPIICVDKTSTIEVDDGISLEPVANEPGNYWYHVHVAHLSAFVTPQHPLGQCAEHRLTTIYNEAAGTMAMLPPWVSRDFSLGPNKPCLTFSAKFNSDGDILDRKVQAGFMRNVVRLSPRAIDKAFGKENDHKKEVVFSLSVGTDPEARQESKAQFEDVDVTEEQLATLRIMHDLMIKYQAKRNPIKYIKQSSATNLQVSNMKAWPFGVSSPDTWKPEFCLVDPKITLEMLKTAEDTDQGQSTDLPSQTIVEEAMILAGSIGAKYARARNIPIVYNGLRPAVNGVENARERLRYLVENGLMNRIIWRQCVSLFATAIRSSQPVEHRFTGLREYTRVTSPLRRHFDLVNMWQIDAALREEHRRQKEDFVPTSSQTLNTEFEDVNQANTLIQTADTNDTAPFLPYTRPQLDRLIRICVTRGMTQKWYANSNTAHWKLAALSRAHYLQEATLPSVWTAEIGPHLVVPSFKSWMLELEAGCDVVNKPGTDDGLWPAEGEIWEIRILDVYLSARKIWMEPVKRLAENALQYKRMQKSGNVVAVSDVGIPVAPVSGDGELSEVSV